MSQTLRNAELAVDDAADRANQRGIGLNRRQLKFLRLHLVSMMNVLGKLLLQVPERPLLGHFPDSLLDRLLREVEPLRAREIEGLTQCDHCLIDMARIAGVRVDDGGSAGIEPFVVARQAELHHRLDLGQWLALQLRGDLAPEIELRARRGREQRPGIRTVQALRQLGPDEENNAVILTGTHAASHALLDPLNLADQLPPRAI